MSSMKEYYEGMSYRELQKIAKGLKIPANLKKNYLIEVITAQKANDEEMVKRITETAYKERLESASTRRTKKPAAHPTKINLGQSRIAPRDPYIILTENNYNTRQTRSRHKTIQHYQPTVQCTNLSSMHLLRAGPSNIGIRYNTIPEKGFTENLEQSSNSMPLVRRKSDGGKQKETMLEALLKAPMSSNIGDVLTDCSQDSIIDCVGLGDDDVLPDRGGDNSKNQWIAGTVSDDNFMDSQQNLNQLSVSRESGTSLSTEQISNAKTFETNFKIPCVIKNNKRLFSSRQMQKERGSTDIKKYKPHDYNSSQNILKNNQNIAKELGLQLNHVNSNLYSEDYTSPLNQSRENSSTFIHGSDIGGLNDTGLSSCYLSNYNASSNVENYHNYPDDDGFFSHNLTGEIDQINPPLTTIDHSNLHNQTLEQNNYNLFNYDSLAQSDELFEMLESENENNSSYANNNFSSNICNQNRNNDNIMNMDIDYDESGFNPLSGDSIVISQHSIRSLKEEILSQESNADRNEEEIHDICTVKLSASSPQDLPSSQGVQENLGQYDDFILNNAITPDERMSFTPELPLVDSFRVLNPDNNMSLTRIPEKNNVLGMLDEDIPIADDRETSQPAAQAADLMNFYRKYGRWEEPYKPMKGTATAMLCFLCNWFGMVANFDDHLRKCHLDQICRTFQGMVTADVNLGVLASGTMLHQQQIIIEHGHHLFVLRFKFKPPDTVCALMLVVPPKGLVTVSEPFPAVVHIQALSQDEKLQVTWSGLIDCLNQPNRPTNVDVFANRCNGRFEVMMREINIVPENLPENEIDLEGLTLAVNVYIQTLEDIQNADQQKLMSDAAKNCRAELIEQQSSCGY